VLLLSWKEAIKQERWSSSNATPPTLTSYALAMPGKAAAPGPSAAGAAYWAIAEARSVCSTVDFEEARKGRA
jgi:hypothetical protein